jgi:hypothetical protein
LPRTTNRRRILAVLAAALMAVAAPAAADTLLGATDAETDASRAVIDLTGAPDLSTTVDASSVPAEATGIGPGSHLLIEMQGGLYGCTASYVFTTGSQLLLSAAGHCFLPQDRTATHGTDADWNGNDTQVRVCVSECSFGGQTGFLIEGTTVPLGRVAYARQAQDRDGEQVGWDFGVVEIPSSLEPLVRTTMPVFGGPVEEGTLATGDQVCHYGNGVVVGEVWPTMGRTGFGLLSDPDAWFAGTAAAPGDSGSALQTCVPGDTGLQGVAAIGTLTHITSLGIAGTTNAKSVAMAADDAGLRLSIVLGEAPTGGGDGTDPSGGGDGTEAKGKPDHAGGPKRNG